MTGSVVVLRLCEAPPLRKKPSDGVVNRQAPQPLSLLCSLQHPGSLQLGGALAAVQTLDVSLGPGRPSGGAGWRGVGVGGARRREAGRLRPLPARARYGPAEGKGAQREQGAARRDEPIGSCSNVSHAQQPHPLFHPPPWHCGPAGPRHVKAESSLHAASWRPLVYSGCMIIKSPVCKI